jgi:hypothetical protein
MLGPSPFESLRDEFGSHPTRPWRPTQSVMCFRSPRRFLAALRNEFRSFGRSTLGAFAW